MQFSEGAADWLAEAGTRDGTRASLHSALSVKETQASSNPSARQEWWGAPGTAARGSSAHPNEVDGYEDDPAPGASQRSTAADETTSPRILLLIPAAERLVPATSL